MEGRIGLVAVAVALGALVACDGGEEGRRVELGERPQAEQTQAEGPQGRESWSPELTAAIDSGNTAYADGRYEDAAAIFSAITEENEELGVAWFGLYMAERAAGNDAAADSAMARVERYAPGLAPVHDSAVESGMGDMLRQMPEGHP